MSRENKTLFIRNLPFATNKDRLEDTFSDYGPIKQCFIVTDRDSGKSKGFGYVQFTLRDDATKAKEAVKNIDGRRVFVDYADSSRKKGRKEKLAEWFSRKQTSGVENDVADDDDDKKDVKEEVDKERDDVDDDDDDETGSETKDHDARKTETESSSHKKADLKYHRAKIVLLGGLPPDSSQEDVEKCLQKLKVKHVAEVKLSGEQIHVKFRSIREAKNGIRKLHTKTYKETELTAVQLSETTVNIPASVLKRSRLIVRNLSFKCSEDDLREAFEECEGMTDASIPVKPDGKKYGFGFVQFNSLRNAMRAVDVMNAKEILGRPVAVDWVLPKDKYKANQSNNTHDEKTQPTVAVGKRPVTIGERIVSEESSGDEGSSSSDTDEDNDDKSRDKDERLQSSNSDDDDSDAGNEDEEKNDSDDAGSDMDEDSDTVSKKKKTGKVKQFAAKPSDVDQGKTIFIRNLSFDRTDEGLEEHFCQYGDVVYSKVVVDPQTEHSKGMGFVKFKSKDTADRCLQEAESSGILLDGRQLIISLAVSRKDSSKFNEKKTKEKKDNRNLYLAREGMIRPGTQAAEGLSKLDLNKRMKVEEVKRQKLKNVNIFISPYRLCVRNIPPSVDDKQLKQVYLKAAGDRSAVITESRIMRDMAKSTSKGVGKSLGYGFVSFREHQHALAALQRTNNNPEIFGENKRLIVEFSLENRKALETKQRRKEKQKMKQEMLKSKAAETVSKSKIIKSGKSQKLDLVTLSEKDKKLKGDKPGGPKGLPSHWGPKVRHKQRPGQQMKKKKAGKKGKGEAVQGQKGTKGPMKQQGKRKILEENTEAPERKKRKRNMYKDMADNFDQMVDKYKQKIVASKTNAHKWFD